MTTEDIAEVEVQKQEEEMLEEKIKSDESAANAQKAKNALNSYYRTIVKKLQPVKFDGTQDLQILAKIKTTTPNGTLFAHAFPATWGAKWESGGTQGQGKMLFLRNGRLCFDIGWVGVVQGTSNLADGKPHKIGLRYTKAENKFSLVVDGNVEASGLHAVDDRVGAEFMIGLSVGHSARNVASMAPIYTGSIDDFRVSTAPAQFATAVATMVAEPPTEPVTTVNADGTKNILNTDGTKTEVTATGVATTVAADGTKTVVDGHKKTVTAAGGAVTTVLTNADGTTTTTRPDGTVETTAAPTAPSTTASSEELDEEAQGAVEIEMAITQAETTKLAAEAASALSEKLNADEVTTAAAEQASEAQAILLEEQSLLADEEAVDATLAEEEALGEIAQAEDLLTKTSDVLEQAEVQQKLDEALDKAKELAARKLAAEAARAEYLAKAAEAKATAEAAKAKAIEIKLAKEKAARARARAEAELKAKTERLNAKVREQALKEAIRAARRKNLRRFGCELAAKTEANEDEAEQIYATAVEVVNRVKAFNKSLTETDAGYKPEYIGCFKDPKRNDRDLPHIYKNYARTKKADCLAAAKKAGYKFIGLQYGGECWMGNDFVRFGQYDDSKCSQKCHLEPDTICGGSWRNSVYEVGAYDPVAKRAETAREVSASVEGIIADIDEARGNAAVAHKLADELAYLTGADLLVLKQAAAFDQL